MVEMKETEREKNDPKRRNKKRDKQKRAFTFDNEFSKVWNPGAPRGLSDAAVKVLICPLDAV